MSTLKLARSLQVPKLTEPPRTPGPLGKGRWPVKTPKKRVNGGSNYDSLKVAKCLVI